MREIKFRAWIKSKNKMIYNEGDDIVTNYGVMGYYSIMGGDLCLDYSLGEIELMQYTELKDKNGKEIYEGDILKYIEPYKMENHLYQVKWRVNTGGSYLEAGQWFFKGINKGGAYPGEFTLGDIEKIGNIHENPELMEKDK